LVRYTGPDHGVLAYAGIEDSVSGYSASPVMLEDHLDPSRPVHQVSLSAPGLLLGNVDPEMYFPSRTYFKPYAVLQNVSAHAIQVSMALVSPDESGTPRTQSLGQVSLQAGETTQFDLESQFGSANPLPNGYGHLTASFQGQDGDLILETGSVDQTKNYVFEVTPSQQADSASRTICFWSVEGSNDSMITVWNYKDVAEDLDLTLYYSGGHYIIPIHLEALEAYNLDMLMLIRSQASDPYGTLIPSNVTSGSALLSSPGDELEKISVAVSASVYSVRNATCGVICNTCNGVSGLGFSPLPYPVTMLNTAQEYVQMTMNTGSVTTNPAGGIWQTGSSAVASISSSGLLTGVSVGQTSVQFLIDGVPVDAGVICASEYTPCPYEDIATGSPVTVSPPCPTTTSINGITQVPLSPQSTPPYLTGLGINTTMGVGPATQNYNGATIMESVSPAGGTCPQNWQQNACVATSPGGLIVGGSAEGFGPSGLGATLPAVSNAFLDAHGFQSTSNVLAGGPSCTIVCAQTYSCGGNGIGNYTITMTLSSKTVNNNAVTQVTVTKN
jgi:hypothetical protein